MTESKITGAEIIESLLGNMHEGCEPLRYSVIPPSAYYVYLHEKDYGRLQGIIPTILREAGLALTEELRNLEAAESGTGFAGKLQSRLRDKIPGWVRDAMSGALPQGREYVMPVKGWQVAIDKDPDGKLLPGDIFIKSLLIMEDHPDIDGGLATKTVGTLRRDGKMTHEESYTTASMPVEQPPARRITLPVSEHEKPGYAELRYEDDDGSHVYVMARDRIVIGRGGDAHIVDIQLKTGTRVSREHLRLRYDRGTRTFYLKDVSFYGTTLNGEPVPSSMKEVNGHREDVGIEVELPYRSRIVLAGMVAIDFESSITLAEYTT